MENNIQPFLITGMARSGTTLLDRMLNNHPEISAISQPLPKLYRYIKSTFLKEIGYESDYYVLGNLFLEKRYSRRDFLGFLNSYKLNKADLQDVLKSMKDWSGQTYKVNEDYVLHFDDPVGLADFYNHFLRRNKNEASLAVGTKEIIVEEFVEYYLQQGIKVILIIRDPRDVFTSLNVGNGPEYGGVHRPALFHLRNWRKSISIANTFMQHPCFHLIKYEDLIQQPIEEMNAVSNFLGVCYSDEDFPGKNLLNSDGVTWQGNSSTGILIGVNASNSGKYRKYLSTTTIEYIEYICEYEMQFHGYELEYKNPSPDGFKEPFDVGDCGLDKMMSTNPLELDKELNRKQMLQDNSANSQELRRFFYSAENYKSLKKMLTK